MGISEVQIPPLPVLGPRKQGMLNNDMAISVS